MKTPKSTKAELSVPAKGVSIINDGTFPAKCATVTAEVLARLLGHERLTGLESVHDASTTRLSAVVHYLAESYGWHITAEDKIFGCRDGRVSWVSEYHLPPKTIARAMADGAGDWCANVRKARAALCPKAAQDCRKAQALNAARKRLAPPGQMGLFEGGQHV